MADDTKFLLGYGERLQFRVPPPKGGGPKTQPYSFEQAKERLSKQIVDVADYLEALPADACPGGEAVALLTLHPSFLAKSYFPTGLLREANLEVIGSRARKIRPKVLPPKARSEEIVTSEIFVAGARADFRRWASELPRWKDTGGRAQLNRIEEVRVQAASEKLHGIPKDQGELDLEVVLHAGRRVPEDAVESFANYLLKIGVERRSLGPSVRVGGLAFVALRTGSEILDELSRYSFLRIARLRAELRHWPDGALRVFGGTMRVDFPINSPQDPNLSVAVFDGGVRSGTSIDPWVSRFKFGDSKAIPKYEAHGTGVTSAVLFGPLSGGIQTAPPVANVDHYRVVDDSVIDSYQVLERIRSVIAQRPDYSFINISLGPRVPLHDEVVDPWTAVIDDLLSSGEILATIAVGNDGDEKGANRIQPPSDSVNGLGIGACDGNRKWQRATYSCVGPGRTPGRVKPDLVTFGGTAEHPFMAAGIEPGSAIGTAGTSFASPFALHTALGLRASLGEVVRPLGLKALLIHTAAKGRRRQDDVGWGRAETDIKKILRCPDGMVRVLFQGKLEPSAYIRMPIPIPAEGLNGDVKLTATFCFATRIDPEDPLAYTRSGLKITFRPNAQHKERPDSQDPASDTFFAKPKHYLTEQDLIEAHKWETVRHAVRSFKLANLMDPFFDVCHYAREGGAPTNGAEVLPYALVVTVECTEVPNLYDKVVQRYQSHLRPLVPVLDVQVKTRS